MAKKKISIVTPTFNEESNVTNIYNQIRVIFDSLKLYEYEHIFIDNNSNDDTTKILKNICKKDKKIKLIINSRNFGPVRSTFYGNLQATGDAVIHIVADLQDPPELIPSFIKKWEDGFDVVAAIKTQSDEPPLIFAIRKIYYNLISRISDVDLLKNFTGFGLYDKKIIDLMRATDDPYPYFRGLVSEYGCNIATIDYIQPRRKKGVTSTSFYSLYDQAMLGITSHSKFPIRMFTLFGFIFSFIFLVISLIYLGLKIFLWNEFAMGIAPLIIGFFFVSSVQLFCIGLLGEYISAIHTQVKKRPLVIERERINF